MRSRALRLRMHQEEPDFHGMRTNIPRIRIVEALKRGSQIPAFSQAGVQNLSPALSNPDRVAHTVTTVLSIRRLQYGRDAQFSRFNDRMCFITY